MTVIIFFQILYYAWPLAIFLLENLDFSKKSDVLIFFSIFIINFIFSFIACGFLSLFGSFFLKLILSSLFVLNGVAMHFMVRYGVVIDLAMVGNVFNTRVSEASVYLGFTFFFDVAFFGVLPAWLIAMQKIIFPRFLFRLLIAPFSTFVFLVWAFVTSSTWPWIGEHSKQLGGLILPWNYVGNTWMHVSNSIDVKPVELLPDGDFGKSSIPNLLTILVIGESARSANFRQYGYERDTQPYTIEKGFVPLPSPRSCTTYTSGSLECILSHMGNKRSSFINYEPLQNYLSRMGVHVTWRTNNWGEPKSIVDLYQTRSEIVSECESYNCGDIYEDMGLLHGLEVLLEKNGARRDFVVLHQTGSHGSNYFEKYPDSFEVFSPVCRSIQLDLCSRQSLLNSYDNTIAYTDYFLFKLSELVESKPNRPTLILYVSDHGESLGESGLYLHGTPNVMAPDVQRNIPFLVWTNEAFQSAKRIKSKWLRPEAEVNQNLVFHSVVGAFDLQTPVYNPELDLFEDVESAE
ncbi:MAG: sulfatase-like hydrolase/transferase [Gammaproteobacteria bacterium]|nr:sulfatase-like hydrolase/transferase [Gammaproteobacteria bacterium]